MCIISVLPKGTKKDSEEVLKFIKNGYDCNRQGSGLMYKKNKSNVIHVIKGFFDLQKLISCLIELGLEDDDELVIHHRIMTHGLTDDKNCHPFVISENHDEVIATNIKTRKPCLAHNGTFKNINSFRTINDNYSDTYTFARYILGNKNIMNIFRKDKVYFKNLFGEIINGSRVVVMYPDRPLEMVGNFIEDNGYFHSNTGYKEKVYNRGGFNYYGCHYSEYDFEDNSCQIDTYPEKENYYDKVNREIQNRLNPKNKDEANVLQLPIGFKQDDKPVKKKGDYMVIDNTFIKLNSTNCFHFKYVSKKDWIEKKIEDIQFLEMDCLFDDTVVYTSMRTEDTGRGAGILSEKLLKEYFYIPKNERLVLVYKDLLRLVTAVKDPTKSTLKRVERLLDKYDEKSNMETIYYHKTKMHVTMLSLLLFKKHLENVLPTLILNEEELDTVN